MVRTLKEVQESRLTVDIREVAFAGNELTVRLTVDSETSEVGPGEEWLAARSTVPFWDLKVERERVVQLQAEVERLRKGHVCTASCKPNAHVAFTGRQRLEELEQEVSDEALRADQNKDWAERAEARLARDAEVHVRRVADLERDVAYWREAYEGREKARATVDGSLESARRSVEMMAGQIGRVRAQVMGPEIRRVLDGSDAAGITGQGADLLARRIRNIRDIVASPTHETPSA